VSSLLLLACPLFLVLFLRPFYGIPTVAGVTFPLFFWKPLLLMASLLLLTFELLLVFLLLLGFLMLLYGLPAVASFLLLQTALLLLVSLLLPVPYTKYMNKVSSSITGVTIVACAIYEVYEQS
jgi:hypothetical protein